MRRSNFAALTIAYASFASMGLYDGLLGVAWPSIRHTFNVSLDSLGLILALGTVGFFVSSVSGGRLLARFGTGPLLLAGSLLRIGGLLGFTLLPFWFGLLLSGLAVGLGTGVIEVGLNTYAATNHRASHMNWLHASYGVGATIAPLMITAVLEAGESWRWAYAIVGVLQVVLTLGYILTLRSWTGSHQSSKPGAPPAHRGLRDTLKIPAVWLSIAIFFVYTGTEAATGTWTYTLLTESRAVDAVLAGRWVSIYWGSFTIGRVLFGFVVDRVRPLLMLRASMLGAVLGAVLIWWNPADVFSFGGLALMGVSLASIYPVMVAVTPSRLGVEHAANAIGFQAGSAGLGVAALPGLAGILAASIDLEIIGPFLAGASLLMVVLHEVLVLRSPATGGGRQRA